jgi:hypothetical protein
MRCLSAVSTRRKSRPRRREVKRSTSSRSAVTAGGSTGSRPRTQNTSSFIREGIDLLLKRKDEHPSGWASTIERWRMTRLLKVGRPRFDLAERLPAPVRSTETGTRSRTSGGPVTVSVLISALKAPTSSATGRWSARIGGVVDYSSKLGRASGCAFLRGACCASDKLAHVLANARR